MDVVEAPADPSSGERHGELKTLVDQNRNGLDDGEEAQANIFEAFFNASACHPGLVNGAFFWDNWIATDAPRTAKLRLPSQKSAHIERRSDCSLPSRLPRRFLQYCTYKRGKRPQPVG